MRPHTRDPSPKNGGKGWLHSVQTPTPLTLCSLSGEVSTVLVHPVELEIIGPAGIDGQRWPPVSGCGRDAR